MSTFYFMAALLQSFIMNISDATTVVHSAWICDEILQFFLNEFSLQGINYDFSIKRSMKLSL